MKRFTFFSMLFLFTLSTYAVDIQEYFASSSTGHYYPFQQNGTIALKFDLQVSGGPISNSFVIAFVLSEDMNTFDHNDILIDSIRVSNAGNGSSEFPTNFVSAAPYLIQQLLKKSAIDHSKTYFVGCILDYNDDIAESDEANNSGAIQMPPVQIHGNVGFNTNLGFWELSINPNPIHSSAIIKLDGNDINQASIQVYSLDGKLVRNTSNVVFPYIFQRNNLAIGTYEMIIINDGKAIIRKKIVIQ
jgi:hypothetical protein